METKFNFKSQIATDKNQSERLLALGLKPETADMCWQTTTLNGEPITYPSQDEWLNGSIITNNHFPAWSLHRLIEMMPENVTSDDWLGVSFDDVSYYHGEGKDMLGWKYYRAGNLYDCIIECIEWLIKEGYFNKEYLV